MSESEPLPDILTVLAEIDARHRSQKIPHSPDMSKNRDSLDRSKRSVEGQSPAAGVGQNINSAPARWMRTETYTSHRIKYARFRWGKGSENWGYVHIAGGSCTNELIRVRRAQVDSMIAAGCDLCDILALLRSWENARAGRKAKDGC